MEPEIQELKRHSEFYKHFDYAGFTAKVLAQKLGVNKSTVSRWLTGKVKPRKEHLEKIRLLIKAKTEAPSALDT